MRCAITRCRDSYVSVSISGCAFGLPQGCSLILSGAAGERGGARTSRGQTYLKVRCRRKICGQQNGNRVWCGPRCGGMPSTKYPVPGCLAAWLPGYLVHSTRHSSRSHIAAHFINSSWNEAGSFCVLHANAAVKRAGRQRGSWSWRERQMDNKSEGEEEPARARQLVVGVRVLNRSFNSTRFRSAVWAARSWKQNCSSSNWRLPTPTPTPTAAPTASCIYISGHCHCALPATRKLCQRSH